jgi:hypothetical protein
MGAPLRKERIDDEELTTADLARTQSTEAGITERRPLLEPDDVEEPARNVRKIPIRVDGDPDNVSQTVGYAQDAQETFSARDKASRSERGEEKREIGNFASTSRPEEALPHNLVPDEAGTVNAASEYAAAANAVPLFPTADIEDLRSRWKEVQTAFVDEPRSAVEQADGLVASAMKRLAEVFADERSKLEQQWDRGNNASTEELRVALQRYRTFFQRLLSV